MTEKLLTGTLSLNTTNQPTPLGHGEEMIRFWWPWPNFQGHHTIKTLTVSLVCTLSPEPIGGFWPSCIETPLAHGKEVIWFWWLGGHIAFGMDPVCVCVASCLHSITWTSGWITCMTKLAQTHYWEGGKKWLDFGDLDLITRSHQHFEILTKKCLSAPYLLNQMTDSGQTSYIVTFGWIKDLVRFWWPWRNFQGHHTIKTVTVSLVCTLSPEPMGGFWPNLHRNTTGTWERSYLILVVGGIYCFRCGSCRRLRCFLSALYHLNQWVDFD